MKEMCIRDRIDGVPNNTPIPPTPPELDAKPLDKVKEPKERRKGRELDVYKRQAPDRLNGKDLPTHHPGVCGLRTRIP